MSDPAPKKKTAKKKAVKKPDSMWIMSTSKCSFWTDRGRVDPGEIAECGMWVAEKLLETGLAEEVKQ